MRVDKEKFYTLLCTFVSVIVTWFINHKIGYGAIVANGIVGVIAAVLLPEKLAGVTYTASFVGMSSIAVIPTFITAALGGVLSGMVILATSEIYAGIGGKGGTTAALSTIITKAIIGILR
jgi:hypothetical protein